MTSTKVFKALMTGEKSMTCEITFWFCHKYCISHEGFCFPLQCDAQCALGTPTNPMTCIVCLRSGSKDTALCQWKRSRRRGSRLVVRDRSACSPCAEEMYHKWRVQKNQSELYSLVPFLPQILVLESFFFRCSVFTIVLSCVYWIDMFWCFISALKLKFLTLGIWDYFTACCIHRICRLCSYCCESVTYKFIGVQ